MIGGVRLKVYTNSIRRARWDARLGFYRNQKPLSCRVSTVLGKGGNIGYMCALVVRVYPMLYLEKQAEGKSGNNMLSLFWNCILRGQYHRDRTIWHSIIQYLENHL